MHNDSQPSLNCMPETNQNTESDMEIIPSLIPSLTNCVFVAIVFTVELLV